MRWNLIGARSPARRRPGSRGSSCSRVDEHGPERFVTLVLMARADKGESGVRSWFALLQAERPPGGELRGPRIGINASLTAGPHAAHQAGVRRACGWTDRVRVGVP